jgi:hypothetical protein
VANTKAMYECTKCHHARQYGSISPHAGYEDIKDYDPYYLPLLRCEGSCLGMTRHIFVRVVAMNMDDSFRRGRVNNWS